MTTQTAAIFYDSTPAENYCRPWRCASTERATAAARALCPSAAADAYAEHDGHTGAGRVRVWVGLRDNRHPDVHALRITELAVALRRSGLDARIVRWEGRARAVRLIDRLAR